jgi:hypothetical protein
MTDEIRDIEQEYAFNIVIECLDGFKEHLSTKQELEAIYRHYEERRKEDAKKLLIRLKKKSLQGNYKR